MSYTTLLLDLDDTLIDTQGNAQEALEEIYANYKLDNYYTTYKEFAKVYFANNNELWHRYSMGQISKDKLLKARFLYPFLNHPQVTQEIADTMNADYLNRVKYKKRTIEGAIELLDYLAPKYKIHILSNGFSELQHIKIASAGLNKYFDSIILSDVVGVNKPHPDIFRYALQATHTQAHEVIMIGDNITTDIAGAQAVGVDQVWFNPTHQMATIPPPTYQVTKLVEIKNIL